jgi:hypothetical protein
MALSIAQLLLSLALASVAYCSPIARLAEHAVIVNSTSQLRETYDYVIIGGGTSGLTVANRLTEDPQSMSRRPNCASGYLLY